MGLEFWVMGFWSLEFGIATLDSRTSLPLVLGRTLKGPPAALNLMDFGAGFSRDELKGPPMSVFQAVQSLFRRTLLGFELEFGIPAWAVREWLQLARIAIATCRRELPGLPGRPSGARHWCARQGHPAQLINGFRSQADEEVPWQRGVSPALQRTSLCHDMTCSRPWKEVGGLEAGNDEGVAWQSDVIWRDRHRTLP
jgi:hypothetical protein